MKRPGPQRGDTVEVQITSLAPGGEGVSKDLGLPIFINRVALGDRVKVEVFDRRADFARAKVVEVLDASPDRIEPPCKLFKVCGGCQWQYLNYPAQLTAKEKIVKQSLHHIGAMSEEIVQKAIPSQKELYYRNKVQFPVRHPQGSSRILAGYYEQDSHRLVNVKHCPIQPALLDEMLEVSKLSCEKFGITAYDETTGEGLLRFINARASEANGQMLVTLVLNCDQEKMPKAVVGCANEITARLPQVMGVCANFNTQKGNKILGEHTTCLTGKPYIEEVLKSNRQDYPDKLRDGLTFRLSSTSFFQINTSQAVTMFERLADFIHDFSRRTNVSVSEMVVLDAYAGVGAIALWLAPFVSKVIAVEENPDAVSDGRLNLKINELENVDFQCGKVEHVMPKLFALGVRPHVIVVDPPRKGCSERALAAVLKFAPEQILYVSCNPVTLARDLKMISGKESKGTGDDKPIGRGYEEDYGYKTEQVVPVDLFPQTYHIESIAVAYRCRQLRDG